jgi:PAS domain S-box-containing protein
MMRSEPHDAGMALPSLSAEDRFARVVEALPTALVLTAETGRIVLVNRQAERMFGYNRAELQGKPLELLMPERFHDRPDDLRQYFPTNPSSHLLDEDRQLFGLRKDGTEFPLELGLNSIELDNEPMMLAGIIDITARHELEREREHQRLELVRSNADLEEFAYIASHDLKAPLRGISHLVQWISEDNAVTASSETLENLKMLRARVTRLQMLMDGLLAYSRVGRWHAAVEVVDIAMLVDDIVAMLAPAPGFVVACSGEMPAIRTHRAPIRVVLENLIGNALKHHDRTEGHVIVAMHRLDDGMVEFRVSDDGPGISPWFHDRIFMIFETLASREDVESSGIGLAIVKKKVEGHGGHIRVESAPPVRGTTFVFTWKEAAA